MVNMGIYGIIRIDLQILGQPDGSPQWWGLTLMIFGAVSAVFGVLQASVATDLKRLLAYSTTENMGLVTLALGAAALLSSFGALEVATIAMTAALLHLLAHAAFKTLGFLAAGSVLAATGLRDLNKLGGLARRMPGTTIMFGISALGASGLPLGAGFVSEWLLLQSLIHSPHDDNTMLALTMPLAVGAVALTTGLGIAAMVKAFGIGFLARPRSAAAEAAQEAPASMLGGMALAASASLVLALAPGLFGPALRQVLAALPTISGSLAGPTLGTFLRLPGVAGSMSPSAPPTPSTIPSASPNSPASARKSARMPHWRWSTPKMKPPPPAPNNPSAPPTRSATPRRLRARSFTNGSAGEIPRQPIPATQEFAAASS